MVEVDAKCEEPAAQESRVAADETGSELASLGLCCEGESGG
jgi:hypothetical protein